LRNAPPAAGSHSVVIRSTVPPGTVDKHVAPALERGLNGVGLRFGAAMCPEFLREGSGISDFYAPSLVIAGTADSEVAAAVTELFGFLAQPVQVVPPRVAESLKYACNAFHATKVSFANEVARLLRLLDVDSRQVMDLFCQDDVLNISPRYLRPGFAFGGSCLPKDLRSLLYMARLNGADLPLLSATLTTNELSISEVIDRVIAHNARAVALFGLSFKASTDDLRESPNVELAERLIGKGFDVRIYDQVVNPSRLVGANLRYINARLPHLRRLLADQPEDALTGADVAIVSAAGSEVVGALLKSPPLHLIDLSGRLGAGVEALAGYEGLGW
jgi:GDP-mannose 6-dehydrogenase